MVPHLRPPSYRTPRHANINNDRKRCVIGAPLNSEIQHIFSWDSRTHVDLNALETSIIISSLEHYSQTPDLYFDSTHQR